MPDVAEWLSPMQAGARLGVSAERIRQLERDGRLAGVRTPLGRLLDPGDVERLAEERRHARGGALSVDEPGPRTPRVSRLQLGPREPRQKAARP
jgi:hypothetical protein